MPKVTIDGTEVDVPGGMTIYQAAQLIDREIPVFCYHHRLDIAGNCRMCLVQVEGAPKPVASCAMPVNDGMVVHTKNDYVKRAREGVLEFLLMHHPLDCPICDQGGECDLQDITMAYGRGHSRYQEVKRAVPPKQMGPIVKTFMTRCIHCTRCVRFADRVAGDYELGGVSRGEKTEITTYLDASIRSELSGNLIDLCPVGALTSAPYAFKGRPWDLTRTNSIDVLDGCGSNISVHTYDKKVQRVLPRLHEDVNEEWISDKARYACDGLQMQRLDRPYIRKQGKLMACSFDEAFAVINSRIKKEGSQSLGVVAGPLADVETLYLLKKLFSRLGATHFFNGARKIYYPTGVRGHYLFNSGIAGIEKADRCLLIGANLRRDAPMVHARLRKHYLDSGVPIAYVGGAIDQDRDFNFPYKNLGHSAALIGSQGVAKFLEGSEKPMLIIGEDALGHLEARGILAEVDKLLKTLNSPLDFNPYNILHSRAGTVGALDMGYRHNGLELEQCLQDAKLSTLYLYGQDDLDLTAFEEKPFIIYQGHHGDKGAMQADVILPGAAYTEKDAFYTNTEGRIQEAFSALAPPGQAKEDWRIVRALSDCLDSLASSGEKMDYVSLDEVRAALAKDHQEYYNLDVLPTLAWSELGEKAKLGKGEFPSSPFNFYQTDVISCNSKTMAQCQQELIVDYRQSFEKAS